MSSDRKKLLTLIFASLWVCGAALYALSSAHTTNLDLPYDFGDFLAILITFAFPGLLFGAVFFWWFSRK